MKRKSENGMWKRITAMALAAVMLAGFLPAAVPEAEAAEWMEPYLNQVVDWGVMQGDAAGNLNPDRQITRAQFVTMVNRAFGYTEVGPNPFTDVADNAWYADDIRIAHQAGYFNGTSPTTASPNALVTREQAAVFIGRNLRLQGASGVSTGFSDDNQMGSWSRGLVQEAADLGIIQGYEDGSFRPKANVTRGQVACFLVRALGSLIHEPGEYDNMGVYGNLAINSPGVKLKNTLITGNLYLTGGVGLGDLELENVEVQGKIIIAGGGEAQGGENSVILRNVTAGTLELDSLTDQFVTLRAEGLTNIGTTNVRTQGYLEDVTEDGWGLKEIRFDAESGSRLDLAGNIKQFINLTPNSIINLAQGVVQKATMDEKATGATVNIDATTNVKELNLDVGSTITGSGDISHMNISAAGSTSSILPDTIFVRPGITSNIKGQQMDSAAAAESSEDPRLLTGYPTVRNVGSRSATAVFSTNKAGTLYWGISALADGSLGEEDLTTTSTTENPKVIRKGTTNVTAGRTEVTAAIAGLTAGGSYYVSALLQDNRGQRSAVKVTAFVTPDDTTPAFVTGYPEAILAENDEGEQIIQARVMANKNCRLHYALMPNNAAAPTAESFKSNSLSGNLGHGVVDLRKNVPWLISQVNSAHLQEETDYDLYLWLTDVDGARSSAVRKLDIRTLDKTPPILQDLDVVEENTTSVNMRVSMNEPGTLYWAVVKEGTQFYRQDASNTDPLPNTETAKMQIETGLGALRKGSVNIGQADTYVNFTISGLAGQTGYDLYFVAKDRAGNYCVFASDNPKDRLVPPDQIHTADEERPSVTQEFTHDGSNGNVLTPYADTSVRLVFSERVKGIRDVNGKEERSDFLALYQDVQAAMESGIAKDIADRQSILGTALANHIKFYRQDRQGFVCPDPRTAANENQENLDWIVDYRKARVEMDPTGTGEMIITLPYSQSQQDRGLNLTSDTTYQFRCEGIYDMVENPLQGDVRGVVTLPQFKTLSATVNLGIANTMKIAQTDLVGGTEDVVVDLSFTLTPNATESVSEETLWDMLIWTDTTMEYTLYSRKRDENGDWDKWKKEGSVNIDPKGGSEGRAYVSLMNYSGLRNLQSNFEQLKTLDTELEFAVHVDSIDSDNNRTAWNRTITMSATVLSGTYSALRNSSPVTPGDSTTLEGGIAVGASSIGVPDPFDAKIPFTDSKAPVFKQFYPQTDVGDISATLQVTIDRPGHVYYVAAPVTRGDGSYTCPVSPIALSSSAKPALTDIPQINPLAKSTVPGLEPPYYEDDHPGLAVSTPNVTQIIRGVTGNPNVISGNSRREYPDGLEGEITQEIQITGLKASTTYILYLVTQGVSPIYSEHVLAYQFTTVEAMLPKINVTRNSNTRATIEVDKSSRISYALVPSDSLSANAGSDFAEPFQVGSTAKTEWAAASQNKPYSDVKTVLDAMVQKYYIGNEYQGSVFDIFATDSAKNTYATLIDQTSQTSDVDVAMTAREQLITVTPPAETNSMPLTMTGMEGTERYTLLVVGHTVNGSGYAFQASRQYYNSSQTYLRVTDYVAGMSTDEKQITAPGVTVPTTGSGKLIIGFSDNLNYMLRTSTVNERYPLDSCGTDENGHSGASNNIVDNHRNIGSMMTVTAPGNGKIELTNSGGHGNPIGNTLEFDVTSVRPNSFIRFGLNLCGDSANMRDGLTLTVYIRYNQTTDDWYAEISPTTWEN